MNLDSLLAQHARVTARMVNGIPDDTMDDLVEEQSRVERAIFATPSSTAAHLAAKATILADMASDPDSVMPALPALLTRLAADAARLAA